MIVNSWLNQLVTKNKTLTNTVESYLYNLSEFSLCVNFSCMQHPSVVSQDGTGALYSISTRMAPSTSITLIMVTVTQCSQQTYDHLRDNSCKHHFLACAVPWPVLCLLITQVRGSEGAGRM